MPKTNPMNRPPCKTLTDKVLKLVDNTARTDQEKIKQIKLKQALKELLLAREKDTPPLTPPSMEEDTFSKHFVHYLAALWSVSGITYVFLVTFTEVVNERVSDTIMGFLMGTIISTIINYFYGASASKSETRDRTPSTQHPKISRV